MLESQLCLNNKRLRLPFAAGHPSLPEGLSSPFYSPFHGCIKSLKIDGERVVWSKVINSVHPIRQCEVETRAKK